MKRFCAILVLALVVSFFCSAQTQTGNASYNESKTGFTISHSSLSFNTRVLVTNLRNNRSVEAIVDYRIPISSERIADISKDAGDAIGMARTGMTLVEIEELPRRRAETAPPVQVETTPPAPGPQPGAAQPPASAPAASSAAAQSPAQPASGAAQTQPAQTVIEEVRYIPVAAAPASCPCMPFLPIFLCLLILVLILLLVILIIYLRHLYLWRKYHLIWLRRHYWYIKRRRK
jgi:rare lipoprotein A